MDTLNAVDCDKSIKRGRLIYKGNFRAITSYFFVYILGAMFIFSVTFPAFWFGPHILPGIWSYAFEATAIVFDVWIIVNLIAANFLLKIKVTDKTINRTALIAFLTQYDKTLKINVSNPKIIILFAYYRIMPYARVVICLLDKSTIHINIRTLARYDMTTPYSGLYNYYKCKRIIRAFKKFQATHSNLVP